MGYYSEVMIIASEEARTIIDQATTQVNEYYRPEWKLSVDGTCWIAYYRLVKWCSADGDTDTIEEAINSASVSGFPVCFMRLGEEPGDVETIEEQADQLRYVPEIHITAEKN